MKLETVQKIIKEVYPKIEKYYGFSKFNPNETPYVETHYNIYARYSGEPEAEGTESVAMLSMIEWIIVLLFTILIWLVENILFRH
tara:strand:+ start:389 stop:643 length:255 start_codon:yes stop_codon:yes gene_type:complete